MASQTRVAAVSTSRATRGSSVRGCGNAGKACSSGQRNQTTSSSSSYFNNTVQKVDQSDVWGTSKELYEEAGGVGGGGRVRQHINPFKKELQVPSKSPNWHEVFKDCNLPLEVDVGCGSGRFLLARARASEGKANFFGMDIRHKLIDRSNKWARLMGVEENVFYLSTNATVSFESVLREYPGKVSFISIQYPDPHFKKRHHKRRIVQQEFIEMVGRIIDEDGHVFLQSDVHEVILDMHNRFKDSDAFRLATSQEVFDLASRNSVAMDAEEESSFDTLLLDTDGWIKVNPTGIPTEREVHAQSDGEDVYRSVFRRNV